MTMSIFLPLVPFQRVVQAIGDLDRGLSTPGSNILSFFLLIFFLIT